MCITRSEITLHLIQEKLRAHTKLTSARNKINLIHILFANAVHLHFCWYQNLATLLLIQWERTKHYVAWVSGQRTEGPGLL